MYWSSVCIVIRRYSMQKKSLLHLVAIAALALTCGCGEAEQSKDTKKVAQAESTENVETESTLVAENEAAGENAANPAGEESENKPAEEEPATTTVAQGEVTDEEGASAKA